LVHRGQSHFFEEGDEAVVGLEMVDDDDAGAGAGDALGFAD